MGRRDPAAKLTDLRPSQGDASTHWGRENGGGTLNVHRDPRNSRVKDNRLWDDDIRVLNKLTKTLSLIQTEVRLPGYCARAGGKSGTEEGECATPRPTRGHVRGVGGTRPEAQARKGGARGGGALPPLTPAPVRFGSVGPSVQLCFLSLPFDAFRSL